MKNPEKPSISEVQYYLDKWDELENYVLQESSLKKLFTQTYKYNTSMDEILIKVCSLNDFYSTNIFSPFSVAKHILNLKIDERLNNNDLELVNDISKVEISGKMKNFYSFATKYCSHHKPEIYPIYDSHISKMLIHFEKVDNFYNFQKKDLRAYEMYRNILNEFRKYYKLEKYNFKDIDRYLWQTGKKYFPKNYGREK